MLLSTHCGCVCWVWSVLIGSRVLLCSVWRAGLSKLYGVYAVVFRIPECMDVEWIILRLCQGPWTDSHKDCITVASETQEFVSKEKNAWDFLAGKVATKRVAQIWWRRGDDSILRWAPFWEEAGHRLVNQSKSAHSTGACQIRPLFQKGGIAHTEEYYSNLCELLRAYLYADNNKCHPITEVLLLFDI